MKLLDILKKINNSNFAKTLTGVAVVLIGAGATFIPAVGPIAGPVIMSAGSALIVGGAIDKVARAKAGADAWAHEKNLMHVVKAKIDGFKNGKT
jgi:hypothetical protein